MNANDLPLEKTPAAIRTLVEFYCLRESLATDDPYDIWKTPIGFRVKKLFNCNRAMGLAPAALLTVFDFYLNEGRRWGYQPQEFPIVRALAAQSLLNLYQAEGDARHLSAAKTHLDWLIANSCTGYSGPCWGLAFHYAVGCNLTYERNTPLSTMTPYALEALVGYEQITGEQPYRKAIEGVHRFFDRDLLTMQQGEDYVALSYAPIRDRVVVNASSYTMYALALTLPYLSHAERYRAEVKLRKLYRFLEIQQNDDGSWYYSPEGKSFIDCFHSCIVLKNVIKTHQLVGLPDSSGLVQRGYAYLKSAMYDRESGLFRRFSRSNKPSLVRFDLYDNAEMLNLALLMKDQPLAESLSAAIQQHFHRGGDIYSQIDAFGLTHNRETLRWAVMPYVYALSQILTRRPGKRLQQESLTAQAL